MRSVHDLNPPASPILTFAISSREALTSTGKGFLKSRLEIRQRGTPWVLFEGVIRSDVEVVQRPHLLRRRWRALRL
jgi:hypothetical protein